MVRLLIPSLCAAGLASAAAVAPCQGNADACAAAGAQDLVEDQVSAIQLNRKGNHSWKFHDCPHTLLGCKTVQPIVDAIQTSGALQHSFANNGQNIQAILDAGGVANWNQRQLMDDCVPDCAFNTPPCAAGTYIPDCSAWSLLKTGLVPLTYNFPADYYSMHPVGFIVKFSTAIQSLVTRRSVIDSDTWQRTEAGMWVNEDTHAGGPVVDEWAAKCPGWEAKTGQKIENTGIKCVEETKHKNGCNDKANPKVFEVPVGKGGVDWPQQFMYDPNGVAFDKANTMLRQCAFEDEELFEGALKAFYAEATAIGYPYPPKLPFRGLYLESELNIQKPADKLLSLIMPDMLAIVVQTTPCAESLDVLKLLLPGQNPKDYCDGKVAPETCIDKDDPSTCGIETEEQVIRKSVRAACLVQKQLSTPKSQIKVVDAKFITNSMTQASWVQHATAKACECSEYCEIDCKHYL